MFKAYQTPELSFVAINEENIAYGLVSFAPISYADLIELGVVSDEVISGLTPLSADSTDESVQLAWDDLKSTIESICETGNTESKREISVAIRTSLGM